jgi:hypothetical protein
MSNKCSEAGLSVPAQNVLDTLKLTAVQVWVCRESLNTLYAKSGHCKETVKKCLKQLDELGRIRIEKHLVKDEVYFVYHLLTNDEVD